MVRMFPAMAPRSTSAHARSAVVSDNGPSGVTTSRFRAPPRARLARAEDVALPPERARGLPRPRLVLMRSTLDGPPATALLDAGSKTPERVGD